MPSKIFTTILADAAKNGVKAASLEADARKWFRAKAREVKRVNTRGMLADSTDRYRQSMTPGNMFTFYYQPKHRDTLPYYDQFPLIFPIAIDKEGILGINLHYLQPVLRAKLLDALYEHLSNDKLDEKTKMQATYAVLKNASGFNLVKPCIKRYLKTHVRSRFVKVYPTEWDVAAMLPTQQFVKESSSHVWAQSRKKAGL